MGLIADRTDLAWAERLQTPWCAPDCKFDSFADQAYEFADMCDSLQA